MSHYEERQQMEDAQVGLLGIWNLREDDEGRAVRKGLK